MAIKEITLGSKWKYLREGRCSPDISNGNETWIVRRVTTREVRFSEPGSGISGDRTPHQWRLQFTPMGFEAELFTQVKTLMVQLSLKADHRKSLQELLIQSEI